jgi:HK97 family phage major capsid protein
MNKLQKLLDKRAALIQKGREVLDAADEEKRNLSAEERSKYDAIMADVDGLNEDIKRMRQQIAAEGDLERRDGSGIKPPVEGDEEQRKDLTLESDEYRSAYLGYLRRGTDLSPEELRAMSIGTAGNGGYLVPTDLSNQIIQALPDVSVVRNYARVLQLQHDRDIPISNSRGQVYWTDEAGAFTESTPTYDKKTLGAYKLTYLVKLSEELLADSGFDLFAELARNYADLAGAAMETKFCQGSGSGEIGGLITGGSAGKTAAAADAITADELIDFVYSLKKQYRRRGVILLNSSTSKAIRKLKNASTGEYLWQPALAAGQPDNLLGHPVEETAGMPDIAATATPLIFGDLSYYTVAERGTRSIQRLNELYAANGQVGFRVFERLDGAVMLSEAIKKFTMAAV